MKGSISVVVYILYLSLLTYANPKGYHITTIETPKDTLFHVTGLDISKDSTVYCATRYGDVWTYTDNTWTLFARGLHEPCGLLIDSDGSVVVAQKPELTRLVDHNKDGYADEYILMSSAWEFHNNYHEFNFGVLKDKLGNYIGTLNLAHNDPEALKLSTMVSRGGYRGWAYKVTPQGEYIPFAKGLRSPAGIGFNDVEDIFYTDNQGDYVGTSMLCQIKQDAFYGHPVSLLDAGYNREQIKQMSLETLDQMRTLPVAWIPHQEIANSPGNPEWNNTKGKFGPFEGQFFVGDQTNSNIFRIALQKVGDNYQGVVINFMEGFQCGNIRLKFSPAGELYVGQTGRGWMSKGPALFGLQKVTWDGAQPFEIQDVKLTKDGFDISFTQALDPKTVSNDNLIATQWWYAYHEKYGSPKVDEHPSTITSIQLDQHHKRLHIKMNLTEKQVYCFNFSKFRSQTGEFLVNSKSYYTAVNLIQ